MHSYSTASSVSSSSRRRPRPTGTIESNSHIRTPIPSSWSSTASASVASSSVPESISSTNSNQPRSRRPALILDASVSSVVSEPPPSTTVPLFASPEPDTTSTKRRLWPNWTGRRTATTTAVAPATTTTTATWDYPTPMAKREDRPLNNRRNYKEGGFDDDGDDEEPYNPVETAAHFSRHATTAGYLTKLDSHTQQHWKRRFCVLQPATHLYYFWSPTDTEPRGCCHVDDAKVSLLNPLPDGRTRIVLEWDNLHNENIGGNSSKSDSTPHRVLLEARSPDVAKTWYEALTTQSYAHIRQSRDDLQRQYATAVKALREAQQKAMAFQSDSTEANNAATQHKVDLNALDEAVRQLTRRLTTSISAKTSVDKDTKDDDITAQETSSAGVADNDDISDNNKIQSSSCSPAEPRDSSLLDQSLCEGQDEYDDATWDPESVPGPSFAALYQVCTQLQEHLRWATLEAQTAAQDTQKAQEEVQRLSKRGAAAEAQLLQMWEENCALRKSLQHKKREKKVLVREVRKLQAAASSNGTYSPIRKTSTVPVELSENETDQAKEEEDEDEEDQLIEELEAHVMSSIRLHEKIMAVTPKSAVNTSTSQTSQSTRLSSNQGKARLHAKPSLLDDFSSDDEDESIDEEPSPGLPDGTPREDASLRGESESLSSVQVEASVTEEFPTSPNPQRNSVVSPRPSNVTSTTSTDSTAARPNPIVQLDALDHATSIPITPTPAQQPTLSLLEAEATTSLASSLTKATDRMRMPESSRTEWTDLQVYHLTFYSRKIGLQFQKVPPPPVKPKGLLTDAVKADFMENLPDNKPDRTAAELRMIASLSHQAKIDTCTGKTDNATPSQMPVDAVLVCGFNGFDESGANVRPKLGARLVAFDGISVEVGRWTFDSIRKAIVSRSRPLTLSFRNEYLTMEQREILTRAVKEANHHHSAARRPSGTTADASSSDLPSSAQSTTSHESGSFVNQNVVVSVLKPSDRNEMDSVSVMTERSIGLETPQPVTLLGAAHKRTPYSFRSFSDVGSSTSSVLSAVGPLMAHLLPPRTPSEPFTPDYMVAKGKSVEETPEHQDFASSLL